MKSKILFIALLYSSLLAFSQNSNTYITINNDCKEISTDERKTLQKTAKKMKLRYNKPPFYTDTDTLLYRLKSGELYLALRNSFDSFGVKSAFLISDDKEMLVFLSLESSDISEKIAVRMDAILEYLRKPTEKWQDMVTYYSPEEAKTLFNADTAFRYTIHLYPADYLRANEREYKYIEKLFIIHKKRGLIDYTCFYTDKAKANFEKYLQPLEQILRFEFGR